MNQKSVEDLSFGEWLRQRRHILDLTQQELADQVGCARITVRRIEAGALKPSKELAQILLEKLGIPAEAHEGWLRFARGLSEIPDKRVDEAATSKPLINLPVALSSFIGREREQAEIKVLLTENRLVTLTGPGGSGKTRLAMQVATELLNTYRNGVWWVELAVLNDSVLVPQTVMKAVGLAEQLGRTPTDSLMDYFQSKNALLILDNCEHLIDSCAHLVMRLLQACQELTILATSREVLNVDGEIAWVVPPLQVPDLNTTEPIAQLQQYDAVRLFIERVKASEQDFHLTNQNANGVVSICKQLAGIPLAIELAAAQVKVLSVEQIAARLEDALQLLTEGKRTAPQRHQTLRATLDWSYDLLTEKEQILFKRLSVFAGGFTLEAVEAVCTSDGTRSEEALNLLKYLVDKSLVVKQVQGIEARFRLLEPIRQYAHKKLFESGNVEAVYAQHLAYFLRLAETAAPELKGNNQVVWFERLEKEHNNLRAALGWALKRNVETSPWKTETALRISNALAIFWGIRGYVGEGRQWLQQALEVGRTKQIQNALSTEQVVYYGHALNWASYLAWWQGDHEATRTFAEEGLILFRELGDKQGIAFSLYNLGAEDRLQGHYTEAQKLLEESLRLRRELDDSWGIADSLHKLGIVAHARGNYAEAEQFFRESFMILRKLGDMWSLADSLNKLGMVAHAQDNYAEAEQFFEESLLLRRELDDKWGIAASFNSLGNLAHTQGDYIKARTLYEESLILSREVGDERGIAISMGNLGGVTQNLGDYVTARKYLKESLLFLHKVGNKPNIAYNLSEWASLALAQKALQRAAKLSGAVMTLLETMDIHLYEPERTMYDNTRAALRNQLDEATFAAAWAEGKAMSTDQAIAFALQED